MQGEGQEFESPRLHQTPGRACRVGITQRKSKKFSRDSDPDGHHIGGRALIVAPEPLAPTDRRDPLIRAPVRDRGTDQRTAGRPASSTLVDGRVTRLGGPHLTNWIVVRQ